MERFTASRLESGGFLAEFVAFPSGRPSADLPTWFCASRASSPPGWIFPPQMANQGNVPRLDQDRSLGGWYAHRSAGGPHSVWMPTGCGLQQPLAPGVFFGKHQAVSSSVLSGSRAQYPVPLHGYCWIRKAALDPGWQLNVSRTAARSRQAGLL
jgi:hypothetical protein